MKKEVSVWSLPAIQLSFQSNISSRFLLPWLLVCTRVVLWFGFVFWLDYFCQKVKNKKTIFICISLSLSLSSFISRCLLNSFVIVVYCFSLTHSLSLSLCLLLLFSSLVHLLICCFYLFMYLLLFNSCCDSQIIVALSENQGNLFFFVYSFKQHYKPIFSLYIHIYIYL